MNFYEKCLQYGPSSKVNETVYSMFQQKGFIVFAFVILEDAKLPVKHTLIYSIPLMTVWYILMINNFPPTNQTVGSVQFFRSKRNNSRL